jgi:nucleotide-binding universal stress UspA family protein
MKPAARCIVCATDFSQNARSAADVAQSIALRLRATLVLMHVADQAHAAGTKDFRLAMRKAKQLLREEVREVTTQNAEPVLLVKPEEP